VTDYEHGVLAALDVVRDRARGVGNALDARLLEAEIRERCLRRKLLFHDEPRSR